MNAKRKPFWKNSMKKPSNLSAASFMRSVRYIKSDAYSRRLIRQRKAEARVLKMRYDSHAPQP